MNFVYISGCVCFNFSIKAILEKSLSLRNFCCYIWVIYIFLCVWRTGLSTFHQIFFFLLGIVNYFFNNVIFFNHELFILETGEAGNKFHEKYRILSHWYSFNRW